jgi:hypothetical protein
MRRSVKIGSIGCGGLIGLLLLTAIIAAIVGGTGGSTHKHHVAVSSQTPTSKPSPIAKSSSAHKKHHHHAGVVLTSCHARDHGKLPDPACTPGATYARVTQANIATTICVAGWTDTVRSDKGHTENLKIKQIRLYGYATTNPFDFEEDHLIPLELGGAPYSPRNLWPERGAIPNPKDSVENALNNAVCDGSVSLRAAQHAMATNWETAESVLGVSGSGGGGSTPAPAPAPAPTHHHSTHAAPAPAPAPTHHHSTHAAPAPAPMHTHHSTHAAPTGCTPKTSSGNCYEAGEFCSDADHGMTGIAGNGDPIKCEGSGSATWHWVHV